MAPIQRRSLTGEETLLELPKWMSDLPAHTLQEQRHHPQGTMFHSPPQLGPWGGKKASKAIFNTDVQNISIPVQPAQAFVPMAPTGQSLYPQHPGNGNLTSVAPPQLGPWGGMKDSQAIFRRELAATIPQVTTQAAVPALSTIPSIEANQAAWRNTPIAPFQRVKTESLSIDLTGDGNSDEPPTGNGSQLSKSSTSGSQPTQQKERKTKTPRKRQISQLPTTPDSAEKKGPVGSNRTLDPYEARNIESVAAKMSGRRLYSWMAAPGTFVKSSIATSSSSQSSTTSPPSTNISFSSSPSADEGEGVPSRPVGKAKTKRKREESLDESDLSLADASTPAEDGRKAKKPKVKKPIAALREGDDVPKILKKWTLPELKADLKKRGLPVKGNKAELIARIQDDKKKNAPPSDEDLANLEKERRRAEQEELDAFARDLHQRKLSIQSPNSLDGESNSEDEDEENENEENEDEENDGGEDIDLEAELEADLVAALEAGDDVGAATAEEPYARYDESSDESEEE